jgi:hypothetical protein
MRGVRVHRAKCMAFRGKKSLSFAPQKKKKKKRQEEEKQNPKELTATYPSQESKSKTTKIFDVVKFELGSSQIKLFTPWRSHLLGLQLALAKLDSTENKNMWARFVAHATYSHQFYLVLHIKLYLKTISLTLYITVFIS